MATISGKRFQITDGASTPTNLFPYTVTEAVYGLSTVIENAKTAVTSVLSAVTLNGVSKAGTTASFYAPAASGTTGQILKATTSGAPVWTSAALGASNKPIYLNSSGVLTEGVSCLPLSAGADYPLTDALIIRSGSDYKIILDNTDTDTNYQGISFRQNGTEYSSLGIFSVGGTNLQYRAGGVVNTVWHSGNSNSTSVNWSAKNLTVAYNSYLHFLNPAGNGDCGYIIGYEGYYGNTLSINGSATTLIRTGGTTAIQIDSSQNVGIGTTSPAYKLEVNGSIGCSTLAARVSSTAQILLETGQRNNASEGGGIAFWKSSYHFGEINASVLALNPRSGGNVGIGTTSPSQRLHVEGSIYAAGGYRTTSALLGLFKGSGITSSLTENDGALYYYTHTLAVWATTFQVYGLIQSTGDQVVSSDLTLKKNLTPVTYSVSDIAKARAVEFDWKDGRGHSMGSIAQDWLSIAPALVHGEEGNMSLAYGQLALVNTIIEAREIETLKARVAELEAEVKRLRMN